MTLVLPYDTHMTLYLSYLIILGLIPAPCYGYLHYHSLPVDSDSLKGRLCLENWTVFVFRTTLEMWCMKMLGLGWTLTEI